MGGQESGIGGDSAGSVHERLRRALPVAMKGRDRVAVAALRSALGAIVNAEAVDAAQTPPPEAGDAPIVGTVVGVGAAEVERRVLTDAQVEAIIRTEVADRRDAAAGYERAGQAERAAQLLAEAGCWAPTSTAGRAPVVRPGRAE